MMRSARFTVRKIFVLWDAASTVRAMGKARSRNAEASLPESAILTSGIRSGTIAA